MTRSVRPILVLGLVAMHAGLTLCAAGLHVLPGLDHGTGLNRPARNDHTHGPGKSSHATADDCVICQFLAQGQIVTGPATTATAWLVARVDLPTECPHTCTPTHRSFAPRAPPRGPAWPTPA
jgi:hypothetical protein